MDLLFFWVNFV